MLAIKSSAEMFCVTEEKKATDRLLDKYSNLCIEKAHEDTPPPQKKKNEHLKQITILCRIQYS
jgi:hypothetical protein